MTRELAEVICTIIIDEGEDAELYEKYSGRGMFGHHTIGITTNLTLSRVFGLIICNAEKLCDNGESMFVAEDLSQDQLGMDYIIY